MNIDELKLLQSMSKFVRKAAIRRVDRHHAEELINQVETILNEHATFIAVNLCCNDCDQPMHLERRSLDPPTDYYVVQFLESEVTSIKCDNCDKVTDHTIINLGRGERSF